MEEIQAVYVLAAIAAAFALPKIKTRLELSKAKHPSLAGHSRMARRVASLLPYYEYDETRFFQCDHAPGEVAAQRRAGFMRLAALYKQRYERSAALTAEAERIGTPDASRTRQMPPEPNPAATG